MSAPSSSSSSETKTQSNKRVVLAYSGGLDTSCILVWLIEKGYQVIAFLADVGQTHDNVEKIKAKALKCGAEKCYVEDARHEFVTDFVFPLLRSTALYEGRYLLGTSIARPCIARHLVKIAHRENCKYISHGATGKGNDQVRFELSANALDPSLITIAPWRDPEFLTRFQGRPDLLRYAAEHNIEVEQTSKAPYSMDENLFHCSYESGILEDPSQPPPEDMFHHTRDPVKNASDIPERIVLEFRDGDPVRVKNLDDGTEKTDPLELFIYLNELGKKHGIGRIDMVENRFVGIKSRGVYETPGGTILHLAHLDLEGICMDREVKKLRDLLAPRFAALAYDGFWYSPEMEFIQAAMSKAQELVDGEVTVQLYKGNVIIKGRSSKNSRYNQDIASMDIAGGYDPTDAQGFIRINSLRLKTHRTLLEKVSEREPKRVKGRITLEANTESKQE